MPKIVKFFYGSSTDFHEISVIFELILNKIQLAVAMEIQNSLQLPSFLRCILCKSPPNLSLWLMLIIHVSQQVISLCSPNQLSWCIHICHELYLGRQARSYFTQLLLSKMPRLKVLVQVLQISASLGSLHGEDWSDGSIAPTVWSNSISRWLISK